MSVLPSSKNSSFSAGTAPDANFSKGLRPLRLVGIGCGDRTRTYLSLAAQLPQYYTIVGGADPLEDRVTSLRAACGNPPGFRGFSSANELLTQEKFADVAVIGTQDAYHLEPCIAAMEKGYDVLLEKPIATRLADVLMIERRARELGRKVLVCHVLRYTPFYRKVKEIVGSGLLGEIISLNAVEGVTPWHQVHSFVRGKWAVVESCTPMIVAKCCHDMDIITWLMATPCLRVNSYGSLSHFTKANAPHGAPKRCTDGCPAHSTCPYNATLYAGIHRGWLGPGTWEGAAKAPHAEVLEWLKTSPLGRCAYQCDNTAVDHQVIAMDFQGGATATFTMTAFDSGRNIEIYGTRGVLRGGDAVRDTTGFEIITRLHANGETTRVQLGSLKGGYESHGGGDMGLVLALYDQMRNTSPDAMSTSVSASVQSHVMAYAAEASRLAGRAVHIPEYLAGL